MYSVNLNHELQTKTLTFASRVKELQTTKLRATNEVSLVIQSCSIYNLGEHPTILVLYSGNIHARQDNPYSMILVL